MTIQPESIRIPAKEVAEHARAIRLNGLKIVFAAGQGRLGSDFSAIDIMATLYLGGVLRIDPSVPGDPHRDRFVLSKGDTAGALYCTLAEAGFIDVDELRTFSLRRPASMDIRIVAISLASRRTPDPLETGSRSPSASLSPPASPARHTEPSRCAATANSRKEACGKRPWPPGWTRSTPGSKRSAGPSPRSTATTRERSSTRSTRCRASPANRPGVIANTHKGSGVSFMTDDVACHHKVPTAQEYEAALAELEGAS